MIGNAKIGTYRNYSGRQDVRVLTYVCPDCAKANAVVLNSKEVPDEGVCAYCIMSFKLAYSEQEE